MDFLGWIQRCFSERITSWQLVARLAGTRSPASSSQYARPCVGRVLPSLRQFPRARRRPRRASRKASNGDVCFRQMWAALAALFSDPSQLPQPRYGAPNAQAQSRKTPPCILRQYPAWRVPSSPWCLKPTCLNSPTPSGERHSLSGTSGVRSS